MACTYRADVLWGEVMNPNYNQTITLYNCFRAPDNPSSKKDIWQKTVLHNCFYKNIMGRTEYASSNLKMQNVYTVRIPESEEYKPYNEWIKLSDEERQKYFTCSLKDIVVKGECAEDITGTSPSTAAEMLSRYKPESFVVTAFSDNTSHRMGKHYRLGG